MPLRARYLDPGDGGQQEHAVLEGEHAVAFLGQLHQLAHAQPLVTPAAGGDLQGALQHLEGGGRRGVVVGQPGAERGKCEGDAKRLMGLLFAEEPFASRRARVTLTRRR